MSDLNGTPRPDPAIAQAAQLADQIMELTHNSGMDRRVVGAALARAQAGFWARMGLDANDTPETVGVAVYQNAHHVAASAMALLREVYARRAEREHDAREG